MALLHPQSTVWLLHNAPYLERIVQSRRKSALASSISSHPRHGNNPNSGSSEVSQQWSPFEPPAFLAKRRWHSMCFNVSCSSDAVLAAIYEIEHMVREPADVLRGLQDHLSTQDLQSVLLHFSTQGRDSWCALEVFEWMQKVNKLEDETRVLMMSIMSKWLMDTVQQGGSVEDVTGLLRDMICVGLPAESDIVHSIVSAYWDQGKKEEALKFASDIFESKEIVGDGPDKALAFLILQMAGSNNQRDALKLVSHFRNRTPKLPLCVYNAALLASVSEQQQLTRVLRELMTYQKRGIVGELEVTQMSAISAYERGLHEEAEQIAGWALDQQPPETGTSIHENLLAMYCVAGRCLEAERVLLRMKLAGHTITAKLYNTVVGICAYYNNRDYARRTMNTMKADGLIPDQKTYSRLFRGFVKGGHVEEAIYSFMEMLDQGFRPNQEDVLAVMRQIPKTSNMALVFKLGRMLVKAALVEPFFVYLYIDHLKLGIFITL